MYNSLKISIFVLVLSGFAGLSLSSCDNNKDTKPVITDTTGNDVITGAKGSLMLHIHNNIGINEVEDYDSVYLDSAGRKISMSMGQFYLSGVQLVRLDGTVFKLRKSLVLKVQDAETFLVGDVPAGNYKGLRFYIGLDSSRNKLSAFSGADSLLNTSSMWFGAAAQPTGFVYLNFAGRIDTTTGANGTREGMQPFAYKLGTPMAYKFVQMPEKNFTVSPNQTAYAHLTADYSRLFTGIQLNNAANLQVKSPIDNAGASASKVSDNIPAMFSYEE
ncbi:MAG: MbnP family protein [Bacteroidota bacterium]